MTKKPIEKLVDEGKVDSVESLLGEESTPPITQSAFVQPALDGPPIPPDAGALPALAKLREAAPPHYISSLPKQTKNQKLELEKNRDLGIRCGLCGGWHHKAATHVPYVGHAAVTDRLLSVDPFWTWEPVAWTPEGLPRFDAGGGMWIKLTICGVTRLGYGHGAQKAGQDPGAREKEVIGDAIRNAAMRFGVALELWHKGELHVDEDAIDDNAESDDPANQPDPRDGAEELFITDAQRDRIISLANVAKVDPSAICDRYGIDSLVQLHADSFEAVIEGLRMTIEKRNKVEVPAGDDVLGADVSFR